MAKKELKTTELERMDYSHKEELSDNTAQRVLDHLEVVYSLADLAESRTGTFDVDAVATMIGGALEMFNIDEVNEADGPIGAFHARIENIAFARSKTERKGIRATMKVVVEHYYNDKEEGDAGKDTRTHYCNVYPCECVSELVTDIASYVGDVLYDDYNHWVDYRNKELEKRAERGPKAK